jgi:hypothetical protein
VINRLNTNNSTFSKEANYENYDIRVIRNSHEIINEISRQIEASNEISVCTICNGGLEFSYNNFFEKVIAKQNSDGHNGTRFVSELAHNNLEIAKRFTDSGIQLRHARIRKLPPLSFSIIDKQVAITIDTMENGTNFQSLIVSNDPGYLNHFKNIFNHLWVNGVDAQIRIKDIEEERETDDEIAEAKHYIDEVLEEINNMKNRSRTGRRI